ncbi:MAG: leucine-rich repeat domain-containing protein [Clostridia bacterium]|nr:leucine-rich repeat domain-containing protein [Clostridia bacterium]
MKIKTKLIASIMSICLVCAVFAIGVFALKTANLKIGGDVSFQATGVEATISNAALTGMTTPNGFATGGKIDTSMTQSQIDSQFTTWQGLTMEFDANATDIVFSFTIKNDADATNEKNNYIELDYSYDLSGVSVNNVDVFPVETNDYIVAPEETQSFGLIIRVLDKELDISNTSLDLVITLKHSPAAALDANDYYQDVKYSLNASAHTASVAGYQNSPTDLIIPAVVTKGEQYYYVTSVSDGAFSDADVNMCNSLVSIVFPNTIKEIGYTPFTFCENLENVYLPKHLTFIGDAAFHSNPIQELYIPRTLTRISDAVFSGAKIKSLVIPSSIEYFSNAFAGCTSLESIIVKNGNQNFDSRNNCNGVVETESDALILACVNTFIPNGIIRIYDCFCGLPITSIEIPNSVEVISDNAFYGCSALSSITFSDNAVNISQSAFKGTLWYDNQPEGVVYAGKVAYNFKGTMAAGASITLREGTIAIAAELFSRKTALTSITMPNSVRIIYNGAFYGCTGLTQVTIPSGVVKIESQAFRGCTELTEVTIPSSVSSIEDKAFYECNNLTSAKFENPNGWSVSMQSNGTGAIPVEISTTDFAANAILLRSTYSWYYNWFRTVA